MTDKPVILCYTILIEKSPQALPLGAACIGSALQDDENLSGKNKIVLDYVTFEDEIFIDSLTGKKNIDTERLAEEIKLKYGSLKCVCFSVYVWNRSYLEDLACKLKKRFDNLICIAGGPEVTADPLSFVNFDYTVSGEGEGSVPLLVEAVLDGRVECSVNTGFVFGIQGVYKSGQKKSVETNILPRSCPVELEKLSSPYLNGLLDGRKFGGVLWELARGCPFKCSYCYESKGEKKIRYFSEERIEKELDLFARQKIPQVFVLDPTYNADKKRAVELLNLIRRKTPDTFYYFEARAEFIDREMAKAFASLPCCLQIGLQSADEKVLANVHRGLNKKVFTRNIGILNEEGVVFGFDLIYGLPGDTLQGFKRSIDFALSLYPNNLELFCLSILPGTQLHEDAESFGMEWNSKPAYNVLSTPSFGKEDLEKALQLSRAVHVFYTEGRAVPWLNSILFALKEKASNFFEEFVQFYKKNAPDGNSELEMSVLKFDVIRELQIKFVEYRFNKKGLAKLVPLTKDIITLNGAMSACTADGTESIVSLNYHPDDLMSEYSADLFFFFQHAGKCKCRAKIFKTKNGPDWKKI